MKRKLIKYSLLSLFMIFSVSAYSQKDVRKNIRKGNKAYKGQKYSEASSFFNEALSENPASPEANYNMGSTLYRQKEWECTVEQYNNFIQANQENPMKMSSAWHNIGNTMLQQKDLEKSKEAYKMALRMNPEDEEARYNLAVVQKMIQDQEEEEQQQDQEQEQDPNQQEEQQNNPDQPQKTERSPEPEQMSRDNARQLLQALEQEEKETQEKVNKIKAEERKQKAEDNRRQNKDW